MEAGNRGLFPVYVCKTRREVKNKYRAVGFSENCSFWLDFIHIWAEKNVCPHFQNCSALSKFTLNDLNSVLLEIQALILP